MLIVVASEAPPLVWQYEKVTIGYSEPINESESNSIEFVESGSDSSSSEESESGTFGVGNSNATVLSRPSFSFSFESTVTEDLDFLNGKVVDFTYFSVP